MTKRKWFFTIVVVFLVAWNVLVQAQQDQVTITTYFPSPNGVFSYMRTSRGAASLSASFTGGDGNLVWGSSGTMGRLSSDQGSSIELGKTSAATPYIRLRKGAVNSIIQLANDNTLYIYVWNNLSLYDFGQTTWEDLHVQRIYYHWGWMNGTIEKANLQYL